MSVTFAEGWSKAAVVLAGLIVVGGALGWGYQLRRMRVAAAWETVQRPIRLWRLVVRLSVLLSLCGLLLLALRRPQSGSHEERFHIHARDILIAVDVSRSMLAQDVQPSRIEFARFKIQDILRLNAGHRIGLMPFAGTAFLQCPPTLDYDAVRMFADLLDPSQISIGASHLEAALRLAKIEFAASARGDGAQTGVLLLISDGENMDQGRALAAAKELAAANIRVFALVVGSPQGAPIPLPEGGFVRDKDGQTVLSRANFEFLQSITAETGGEAFAAAADDGDVRGILARIGTGGTSAHEEVRIVGAERFDLFIAAALLLLILESFFWVFPKPARTKPLKSAVLVMAMVLGASAPSASGLPPSASSQEDSPEAAYNKSDFAAALRGFTARQNDWMARYNEGVSAYRFGQWEHASQAFSRAAADAPRQGKAKSFFNLGNARMRLGDPKGAKDAFQQALGYDADFTEARENLEALEKMQKPQDQPRDQNRTESSSDAGSKESSPDSGGKEEPTPSPEQRAEREKPPSVDLGRSQSERILEGIDDRGDQGLYMPPLDRKDDEEGSGGNDW